MRSFLVIGLLALVVGAVFLRGHLPRRAGAGASAAQRGLELAYADYDHEEPLVFTGHGLKDAALEPPHEPDPAAVSSSAQPADAPEGSMSPDGADDDPTSDHPALVASAGPDQNVWLGGNELRLDGSRSFGQGLTYHWRQIGGPNELKIKDSTAALTTATGFPLDTLDEKVTYEFELTVRDAHGREATDSVRYVVKAGPTLSITPTPKRQLAYRDGYLLAHFEAWRTNRTEYAESFEIRSPTELTFHRLTGDGEFDVTVEETSTGYLYVVTVYYTEGEASTWLEFFVDTPERLPAILQFGVNWE